MQRLVGGLVLAYLVLLPGSAGAQLVIIDRPTIGSIPRPIPVAYRIRSVDANVTVRDQIATVQFSQVFENVGSRTLEARLLFPLPADAAITPACFARREELRTYRSVFPQLPWQRGPALPDDTRPHR